MNNEMSTYNMSNEKVIDILKGIIFNGFDRTTSEERQALHLAIKALEERPQGEWEDYSVNFYKCPECGYLLNKDCPNCQNKIVLPNSERPHEKQRW